MKKDLTTEITESLEIDAELLPWLPYLLTDLWDLGSSPDKIIEILFPLKLPPGLHLLDLGCGKGAVAVQLAKHFGFRVTGVDGFPPFLEEAKKKAAGFNVSHLCYFQMADVRTFIQIANEYDIIVYASLGGLLGNFQECIAKLRERVRPGGYVIFNESFLKKETPGLSEAYRYITFYEESRNQLAALGDEIIGEMILSDDELKAKNDGYMRVIRFRAEELSAARPELKDLLTAYVRNQYKECEILNTYTRDAIWLLKIHK